MSSEVVDVATPSSETPKRKYYIERVPGETLSSSTKKGKSEDKVKAKRVDSMLQVLMAWPNKDIWPFKIAAPLMALSGGLPGLVLNNAFRKGLLLSRVGNQSSYFATVGIPAVLSGVMHAAFITSDILEQNTACPVCVQVRSAACQIAAGVVYPAMLTPIVNFHLASGLKDIYLPKITKNPGELLQYAVNLFSTVKTRFFYLAALQIVVAMGITHLEQTCFNDVVLPVMRGENDFSKETRKIEFKDRI
ncbi:unnamed protein product [Orchesella dallaii]|uniref:Transmembrane protein n=1 Tax=Orchesella dallaii TaxID=48710 RepID=A0ABP1QA33_9HEXA